MASKAKREPEEKAPGILGSIPLGTALDAFDGVGSFLYKLFLRRYRVEERIEDAKEEAKEKVTELKEEAIKTGYAVKKAFFRAIVEAILLTTGIVALIAGTIMAVADLVPLKFVLLGYGVIMTAVIVFQLKTKR
jgi:hypothetical protein